MNLSLVVGIPFDILTRDVAVIVILDSEALREKFISSFGVLFKVMQ